MPKPIVVILCGGRGTRIHEHSADVPKPLIEIGDRPIVWHVMGMYFAHGFRRFLLLTGYRADQVQEFVATNRWPREAEVECLDTGADTPTGERLRLAAAALQDEERFCLAYADGLADIDLAAVLVEHEAHGARATMAVVQPRLPFGVARLDGAGAVLGFSEKPRSELWVNAGFLCLERSVFETLEPGSTFEREPLARLAAAGQLYAYRHQGFWECMDTHKDWIALNELWDGGRAPWVTELN